MTEPRNDDRSQARREAAALLGVDIDHLSPADGLRVDMVSALRLVIDHEQATVLSGNQADLGKLNVAVQSLIALLPGRELPEPESSRDDRDAAVAPLLKLFRHLHESVHTLSAENAQLRAALGGSSAITPREADICPPGEIGEFYRGIRSGPDDPKPPVILEGESVPASSALAPQPQMVDLRAGTGNSDEPWRDHVLPDGTITPTPMSRGRWWGPV